MGYFVVIESLEYVLTMRLIFLFLKCCEFPVMAFSVYFD